MKLLVLITYLFIQTVVTQQIFIINAQDKHEIVKDCNYTFEEAVTGIEIPESIINQLTLVDVEYYSFDEKLHRGQLVINKKATKDIIEIFQFI
ncbi:MAG TPA: hypothetical protein VF870_04790, partial [Ignavibacteriaceae bacterium]